MSPPTAPPTAETALGTPAGARVPEQSLGAIFVRFLRFGCLAWGGPVAQIAMIREELVEREGWISRPRFNRVLAVYQALPGPEAHELCVYFGMLARGRAGAVLAGLGFMLPGLLLMLALSWAYVRFGIASPIFAAAFYGCQPAVVALIVRATHRIGQHALTKRWLAAVAVLSFAASLWFMTSGTPTSAPASTPGHLAAVPTQPAPAGAPGSTHEAPGAPSVPALFGYGLRTGLLTFGGAYTAIPFLQHDAVVVGGWMSTAQFLDGLALSGLLPAPLIIFATFVGYLGGGLLGALALTLGVFLPAFAFTLLGHGLLERLVELRSLHALLDAITAAVVGLIAATAVLLLRDTITDLPRLGILLAALLACYVWKARGAVAGIMLGAALLGLLLAPGPSA
ncbi:MAG: chromate transporter [Planctomycetota bacterium]